MLINITPSFFIKEPRDLNFAGLDTTIPNHYDSVDRPIGNETLWLYFTKDQHDKYRLSINGPLTIHCKNQIAYELNHVMAKILENGEYRISDLTGTKKIAELTVGHDFLKKSWGKLWQKGDVS